MLVRIKATGQVIDMVEQPAYELLSAGMAEEVSVKREAAVMRRAMNVAALFTKRLISPAVR